MKRTFCDRCGAECNGERLQRFTIFDVNRAIDVCENCYSDFFKWLNSGKDSNDQDYKDDSDDYIALRVLDHMKKGDLDGAAEEIRKSKSEDDGVDEFIKDVMNPCEGCNGDLYEDRCNTCEHKKEENK